MAPENHGYRNLHDRARGLYCMLCLHRKAALSNRRRIWNRMVFVPTIVIWKINSEGGGVSLEIDGYWLYVGNQLSLYMASRYRRRDKDP